MSASDTIVLRSERDILPNLQAYALIFELAALLLILSSKLFVSAGEPPMTARTDPRRRACGPSCAAACWC